MTREWGHTNALCHFNPRDARLGYESFNEYDAVVLADLADAVQIDRESSERINPGSTEQPSSTRNRRGELTRMNRVSLPVYKLYGRGLLAQHHGHSGYFLYDHFCCALLHCLQRFLNWIEFGTFADRNATD